jgi:processing peptidase subunit beta
MLTYNRRIPVAELFARIDAVDAEAVRGAADEIINDQEHACAATGPILELPDYNWMRNRSFWLRY